MLWGHPEETESGREEDLERGLCGELTPGGSPEGKQERRNRRRRMPQEGGRKKQGRLGIPIVEGEVERRLLPRRWATGKRNHRKGYGAREVSAPWVWAWHWVAEELLQLLQVESWGEPEHAFRIETPVGGQDMQMGMMPVRQVSESVRGHDPAGTATRLGHCGLQEGFQGFPGANWSFDSRPWKDV